MSVVNTTSVPASVTAMEFDFILYIAISPTILAIYTNVASPTGTTVNPSTV